MERINMNDSGKKEKTQRGGRGELATRASVGVLIFGCVMLLIALILPPPGQIDHTVLVAFGEICTFSGTVLGIREKLKPRA